MSTRADIYQTLVDRYRLNLALHNWHTLRQETHMPSLTEILDGAREILTSDSLISAAASTVLSPEGKALAVAFISGLEQLEAKHTADKQAAVEQAKAEATAAAQPPAEPQA